MKKHVPNLLTLVNLLCGSAGIIFVVEKGPENGLVFIVIAGAFDFFDGLSARLLKVKSAIGKELDSLADMVSFGALPAIIMYKMLQSANGPNWVSYAGLGLAAFAALRLAKFNVDERQTDVFFGLPTPAMALFIGSLPFIGLIQNVEYLVAITVLLSYLMIADLELFALKFASFGWKGNEVRFLFLGAGALLVLTLKIAAVPIIICLYVITSLFLKVLKGKQKHNTQ